MSLFIAAAVAVLLLAYAFFLPSLWRRSSEPATVAATDSAVYRQRRRELAQEHARGDLDEADYAALCRELDLQMLDETVTPAVQTPHVAAPARWPIVVVLLALPFMGYGVYGVLGRPDLINLSEQKSSFEDSLAQLKQRLEQNPNDIQGWLLLARSLQTMHKTDVALQAYDKAMALAPDNFDIKALYAQALAEQQDNRLQGRPAEIIADILAHDADHPMALWMAGLVATEAGDATTALRHWRHLRGQYADASEDAKQLDAYIGMLQNAQAQDNAGNTGGAEATPEEAAAVRRITVKVSLAANATVQPDDTVFIFAKAAQGPPMPLAMLRKQVKDLPVEVVLDDNLAMTPSMKLSNFDMVVVGARVSRSGNAKAASGDWQGLSVPLVPSAEAKISLEINQRLP